MDRLRKAMASRLKRPRPDARGAGGPLASPAPPLALAPWLAPMAPVAAWVGQAEEPEPAEPEPAEQGKRRRVQGKMSDAEAGAAAAAAAAKPADAQDLASMFAAPKKGAAQPPPRSKVQKAVQRVLEERRSASGQEPDGRVPKPKAKAAPASEKPDARVPKPKARPAPASAEEPDVKVPKPKAKAAPASAEEPDGRVPKPKAKAAPSSEGAAPKPKAKAAA